MEEALVQWLLSIADLTAAVANRITFLDRPTDALPAITIQVTDANSEYTHEGRSDLQYPRIQFDVWGKTYTSTKQAARKLVSALEAGADRPTAVFFEGIEVNNSDMPTETLTGGTKVFRILVEYYVPFKMKGA